MQYAFSSCQSTPYSLLMNQEILPVYYTVATPLPPPQKKPAFTKGVGHVRSEDSYITIFDRFGANSAQTFPTILR